MQDYIKEYFKKDRFAMLNGISVVEAGDGTATARLDIADRHMNAMNAVQGGAIFTLADFACAVASNSGGLATVSIAASIQFFSSPKGKFLLAKAHRVHSGRKICGYDVNITDEDGSLVAKFSGTGYVKGENPELKPKV